MFDTVKDQHL